MQQQQKAALQAEGRSGEVQLGIEACDYSPTDAEAAAAASGLEAGFNGGRG
jgi:hypothetical protein